MSHDTTLRARPRREGRGDAGLRRSVLAAWAALSVAGGLLIAAPAVAAPPSTPVTDVVDADSPSHHWRLGEAGGERSAEDRAGASDLTLPTSAVRAVPGATADGDAATTFAGGTAVVTDASRREKGPQSFSVEAWVRTTTRAGGKLVGFEDEASGTSAHYDRHLWMDDAGRVSFGVWDGSAQVVRSPGALNDGGWHQVVGSVDRGVVQLFVDGALVGARDGVAGAERFDGYWRLGGGRLDGWPGTPTSPSFDGDLDDVAVYGRPLSAERVAAHHAVAEGGASAGKPGRPGEGRRTDFGSYRPGPSTTGAYGSLTPHRGDLVITTPGQVVEGLDVSGVLRIKADGVTVRRTVVRGGDRGQGYRGAILMALEGDQRGAVIEDVTVRPSHPVVGMNAVQVSSATLHRADISGATDGIVAYGDDITLAGNYVHDLRHYRVDPWHRDGSHDDALQIEGGSRISVVGNSLSGAWNAGIQVTQNHARVRDLTIDRNHLSGGYLTVNTSEKRRGAYSGFSMTDNRFGGDERNGYGVQAAITRGTRDRATVRGNVVGRTGEEIRVVDAGS